MLDFGVTVWMIRGDVETVGEFLTQCGARLAPFERARVGRAGCGVSLAAMAAAAATLALGLVEPGGWARAFRIVILSGIGTALALFVIYAAAETLVERTVRRRIDAYLKEGGTDLEVLVKAAEMRRGRLAGGARLLEVLTRHGAAR